MEELPTGKPVRVDFTQAGGKASPFQKARSLKKRLKLFFWGDQGVGNTMLSLQFPSLVVIELEGGTDRYRDESL